MHVFYYGFFKDWLELSPMLISAYKQTSIALCLDLLRRAALAGDISTLCLPAWNPTPLEAPYEVTVALNPTPF